LLKKHASNNRSHIIIIIGPWLGTTAPRLFAAATGATSIVSTAGNTLLARTTRPFLSSILILIVVVVLSIAAAAIGGCRRSSGSRTATRRFRLCRRRCRPSLLFTDTTGRFAQLIFLLLLLQMQNNRRYGISIDRGCVGGGRRITLSIRRRR
jgi:hypothetical protein